jgi:quinol monooxygenase YgiN
MPIIIAGHMQVDPARRAEALAKGKPFIDGALTQKGCIDYAWTPDPHDPARIWVFERWADEASLAAHFKGPHYLAMRENIGAHGLTAADVSKYGIDKSGPVYDSTFTPRADFFDA